MTRISDFKVDGKKSAKELFSQFDSAGFQASELSNASKVLKQMVSDNNCARFLSFTSNMMASGLRGIFTEMERRKMFDAVITAGGSIDHDLIRSYSPYELGSFSLDDVSLHKKGVNRLGNILVDNEKYILLEKKMKPILNRIYGRKKTISTRELITEIGSTLQGNKNSFLGECFRQKIPVFCPGLIDSAIGLQLFFFKQDHRDFVLDATADMSELSTMILSAKSTGALILGGGISKHYTIGSNLLRGGLDYSVYVTTASAYDGSLSGAVTNEAKSWGKIKEKARTATVYGDATIILPLLYSSL